MDTGQLKPFDLEKAKAGEPIMVRGGNSVKFLGVLSNGRIAVEIGEIENAHATDFLPESLRMLPKVKKFRGILYTIYGDRLKETHIMADTEHNRDWARRYNHEILTEFEVEYEEK